MGVTKQRAQIVLLGMRVVLGMICLALQCSLSRAATASSLAGCPQLSQNVGLYFDKKTYVRTPLLRYRDVKDRLPSPIDDEHPLWIQAYWKAWELAFLHLHEPVPGSGFVSQFIDAGFSDNVYLWDSAFMTMFMNTASGLAPSISTLDNFYARQLEDGEICREMIRATGACWRPWVNDSCVPLSSRFGWSGDRFTAQIRQIDSAFPVPPTPSADPRRSEHRTTLSLPGSSFRWSVA